MFRMYKGFVLTAAALLGLMGCAKENLLQPPKPKDEYKTPPADDPRFVNPPNYPNKLLNQDTLHKSDDDDDSARKRRTPRTGFARVLRAITDEPSAQAGSLLLRPEPLEDGAQAGQRLRVRRGRLAGQRP